MKYPDDKVFLKLVGTRLRLQRKRLQLTQLDVGLRAGMKESAVQRVESGRINSTLKSF